jgi:hypothetical protein
MSTTTQLYKLTPWRALHRMWTHFAMKWELPTSGEREYFRGLKAGQHVAEEKLRVWYRTAFEAGYKQATEDLPICHVQPAVQVESPHGRYFLQERTRYSELPHVPTDVLKRTKLEPMPPSTYEPPEKHTRPIYLEPEDKDATSKSQAIVRLRHEGRKQAG